MFGYLDPNCLLCNRLIKLFKLVWLCQYINYTMTQFKAYMTRKIWCHQSLKINTMRQQYSDKMKILRKTIQKKKKKFPKKIIYYIKRKVSI